MYKSFINGHAFNVPENAKPKTSNSTFPRKKGIVEHLPYDLKVFLYAVAAYYRTSLELVFTGLLATLAISMMGAFQVEARDGWLQPLALYAMTIANPGENKSSVLETLIKPLKEAVARYNIAGHDSFLMAQTKYTILKKRLSKLEKEAEKGKANEIQIFEARKDLEIAETELKAAKPVLLFVDDVTNEKLAELLAENREKLAIAAAEGGFLQVIGGLYANGKSNIDLLLRSVNGEKYSQHRISRESIDLQNPLLVLNLFVQDKVLADALQNDDFIGRGLMARFLIAHPESKVGKRDFSVDPPMYDDTTYTSLMERLMQIYFFMLDKKPKILRYSADAKSALQFFSCEVEKHMLDELYDIKEFCNKIAGVSARIAAILHVCNIVAETDKHMPHIDVDTLIDKIVDIDIPQATADAAIEIAKYYIGEARYIYSILGLKKDTADAYVNEISRKIEDAAKKGNKNVKKDKNGLFYIDMRGLMRLFHVTKKKAEYDRFIQAVETLVNIGNLSDDDSVYYLNPTIYQLTEGNHVDSKLEIDDLSEREQSLIAEFELAEAEEQEYRTAYFDCLDSFGPPQESFSA